MHENFQNAFRVIDGYALDQLHRRGEVDGVLFAQREEDLVFMPMALADDSNRRLQELTTAKVALDEYGAEAYFVVYQGLMQTRVRVVGRDRPALERDAELNEVLAVVAVSRGGQWWLRTRKVRRNRDQDFVGLGEPELMGPQDVGSADVVARLFDDAEWDIPEVFRRTVLKAPPLRPLEALPGAQLPG